MHDDFLCSIWVRRKSDKTIITFLGYSVRIFFRLDFYCLQMTQTPNVLSYFRTKPTHTNTKNQKTTSFRKLLTQYKSCEVFYIWKIYGTNIQTEWKKQGRKQNWLETSTLASTMACEKIILVKNDTPNPLRMLHKCASLFKRLFKNVLVLI